MHYVNRLRVLQRLELTENFLQVASWWDYGYQTTAMANRTVIVDNNTWNNTHIATVGTAMSSPERAAWEIFNSLDVKYVFVVFGGSFLSCFFWSSWERKIGITILWFDAYFSGLVGYSSDDIILWSDAYFFQVLLAILVMILISFCGWFA